MVAAALPQPRQPKRLYLTLDYICAAELIRSDLEQAKAPVNTPVCVDGLDPPPHYDGVGRDTRGTQSRLRHHTALTVFAQTLRRRDLSRLRLDCGGQAAEGTYHYAVRGTEVGACS